MQTYTSTGISSSGGSYFFQTDIIQNAYDCSTGYFICYLGTDSYYTPITNDPPPDYNPTPVQFPPDPPPADPPPTDPSGGTGDTDGSGGTSTGTTPPWDPTHPCDNIPTNGAGDFTQYKVYGPLVTFHVLLNRADGLQFLEVMSTANTRMANGLSIYAGFTLTPAMSALIGASAALYSENWSDIYTSFVHSTGGLDITELQQVNSFSTVLTQFEFKNCDGTITFGQVASK